MNHLTAAATASEGEYLACSRDSVESQFGFHTSDDAALRLLRCGTIVIVLTRYAIMAKIWAN